jgi:murein DD-endopeptidase
LTNLFNHTQTLIEDGWSVKKKQVRDFRGKDLTYDSHNGTDFAVPVGSLVLSAAAGRVVWMCEELNRGGRKIFIDHGHGLMTTYAHLARSLVSVGQEIQQGEPIAWSGYSGLDAVISFPFGIPHVHFNVWFNGTPVDPFAFDGMDSLWIGDHPIAENGSESYAPSEYDVEQVEEGITACMDPVVRAILEKGDTLAERASALLVQQNYYPTRFSTLISPYRDIFERRPRLRLPFLKERFDDVVFRDEV